jgi:hypothetical protein
MENLLDEVQRDTRLTRAAATYGGEFAGACPFCGGTDRFRVWPEKDGGRWWCRQCDKSGDLVAYLVEVGRMTTSDAYRARHGDQVATRATPTKAPAVAAPEPTDPPPEAWQERAWAFVAWAQSQLWGDAGADALAYLHGRGLTDETVRHAGLGYNTRDWYEERTRWGMPEGKRIWLPRGVVIPWFIGRDLWRVNVRRWPGEHDPKVIGPAGYTQGLYEADRVSADRPAILVEGELDVLSIQQAAPDLVTAVATGSTGHGRRARWAARLAVSPLVLVSFDAGDEAEPARAWWLEALPNGRYWRPYWGDGNDLLQAGALRGWIEAGLR